MWLIAIMLAAICNSVMDSVLGFKVGGTIFSRWNPNFWNEDVSWNNAKRVGGYKLDAWHIAKSGMVVFMVVAVILYHHAPFWQLYNGPLNIAKDLSCAFIAWNGTFDLFYNKIWKK